MEPVREAVPTTVAGLPVIPGGSVPYRFIYISGNARNRKPLEWVGSSYKDLMSLPPDVRRFFGFALSLAQADVTYRVDTIRSSEAVFVLHCFQKKSKRGIATPREDMDIIHARLKVAEAYVKELRK